MKAHRIRLVGPWEARQLDNNLQPIGDVINCQLPYSVMPQQNPSGVLLLRGFHCPTGIDQNTILRIILKANQQPHEVRMNSMPAEVIEATRIGNTGLNETHREFSIDITPSIAAFNHLIVIFQVSRTEIPASLETAWLEIQD